jgi:N-acetylmuramoyl-L-alanine amidase
LHWINRFAVRIGSAGVLATLALLLSFAPGSAQNVPQIVFDNQRLNFTHAIPQKNDLAVALHDPAVTALLARAGASVTWQPGERYVLVTTAEPRIVSFALGDTRYDIGDVSSRAAFAPFERGGDVYLPLYALAHALYLEPKTDRQTVVLQPQIAVAELQSQRDAAALVLHGALPLKPRKRTVSGDRIVYEFAGFGSTLERSRKIHAAGLSEIDVEMAGTTRDPLTRITLVLAPGANAADGTSGAYHDFSIALAAHGAVARAAAPPSPPPLAEASATPEPAPGEVAAPGPAAVTAVDGLQNADGFDVQVTVDGNASYDWHRLLDNRWYLDIHNARLQAPPGDTPESAPSVTSLRVHQLSGDTVRVALTLTGSKQVDVAPSARGLSISVKDVDSDSVARSGSGTVGANATAYNAQPSPGQPADWKFSPTPNAPASSNPRLIVIDPGHGGSDGGAYRGALSEKALNLDLAKRLRTLLVARGWQVQMTRTTDVDVYQPNDSAHDELQARDDIANQAGARLFVSVHTNSFSGSGPNGTTTYFYKGIDRAFADAIHRRFQGAALGTKDDGVIKNNFYVLVHSNMPAVLIETAFLSNPDDYALLSSPAWLQKIAQAIADGIGDYAGSPSGNAQSKQR